MSNIYATCEYVRHVCAASVATAIRGSSRIRVLDAGGLASGCIWTPRSGVLLGTPAERARTKDSPGHRGSRRLLLSATTAAARLVQRAVRRESAGREVCQNSVTFGNSSSVARKSRVARTRGADTNQCFDSKKMSAHRTRDVVPLSWDVQFSFLSTTLSNVKKKKKKYSHPRAMRTFQAHGFATELPAEIEDHSPRQERPAEH